MRKIIMVVLLFWAGSALALDDVATLEYQSRDSLTQELEKQATAERWDVVKSLKGLLREMEERQ